MQKGLLIQNHHLMLLHTVPFCALCHCLTLALTGVLFSPEFSMLLMSSRKPSCTICVSLNKKTTGSPSTPAVLQAGAPHRPQVKMQLWDSQTAVQKQR
jgi:hypothetical protein